MNDTLPPTNANDAEPDREGLPRPPLWSRLLRCAVAVGILVGLLEVCWLYRLTDLDPDWRSAAPATLGGFTQLTAVAVTTDVVLMLVVAMLCGIPLAIWRDLRGSGGRDRRFAPAWMVLSAGGAFLWIGCVGLYVFPATSMHTWRYLLTMGIGLAIICLASAAVVGLLNRLRRLHRALPTLCWGAVALCLLAFTLPAYSRQGARDGDEIDIPLGGDGPLPNV
ncbi:MAG TPA: hypothetical protein P5572_15710, partial [Phycisphaerae bacterium]|nr:hypothetical protein [Phycisphaerae bacterium]